MLAIAQQFCMDIACEGIVLLLVLGYALYFWINYVSVDKAVEKDVNSLIDIQIVRKYRK